METWSYFFYNILKVEWILRIIIEEDILSSGGFYVFK